MNKKSRLVMLAGACLAATAWSASAADKAATDLGKQEYEANCIVCHGANGKGGAYVDMLRSTPPDLSTLAKRNGGVFPVARVYETIDGRALPKGHGASDMPVWGQRYRLKAAEHYVDVPYNEEQFIRARVLALIDYLNRMQDK